MPPRTLASLAHALSVAPDAPAALLALGDALLELDRLSQLALIRFDGRRQLLRERLAPAGESVRRTSLDTAFDHIPSSFRAQISAGGAFVDIDQTPDEFARLLGMTAFQESGWLSVRGIRFEGELVAILALYESRKIFGTRTAERFGPLAALFDLAYARFLEQEARHEAVRTLEDVTQRVHEEYERKLSVLEQRILRQTGEFAAVDISSERVVAMQREMAHVQEALRRAEHRAQAVEATVGSAVEQLEKAHVELHRRSETLRQKTRTLYLIERVLAADATTNDPRQLVDGLLSLVGDDMHAQRCSLMLCTPEGDSLYLAAARGIAPGVTEGARIPIGVGVAGRVAAAREPLLVQDVADAKQHPLLKDQYFTTGSFISFPLVYHDELVGVVNLTNRAMQGIYVEEDVERVRLLGLVIALVATRARLRERLVEALSVR